MCSPKTYDQAKRIADSVLFGLDMTWDSLPDYNSLHDYVDDDMDVDLLCDMVKEACYDRLIESGLDDTSSRFWVYGLEVNNV